VFINLDHHDKAYDSEVTRRLVKRLMDDEGLLAALEISNIQIEDFINLVRSVGKQK